MIGEELGTHPDTPVNPYRYAMAYWDQDSDSYYMMARYYEPEHGK